MPPDHYWLKKCCSAAGCAVVPSNLLLACAAAAHRPLVHPAGNGGLPLVLAQPALPSGGKKQLCLPCMTGLLGRVKIQMQPVRRIACSDRSWCARIGGTDGYGLLRSVVAAKMGQARLSMPAWTLGRNGRIRTTLRIVLPLSCCGPARITCSSPAAARDSVLQREGCGTTAAPFPAGCLLHTPVCHAVR